MTLSFTAFILSGLGIGVLMGFKMLQTRLGFLLFWPDTRAKCEKSLSKFVNATTRFFRSFNKHTFYIILHYTLTHLRTFFVYIQQKIDKKLVHLVNLIRGKKVIEINSKTSRFLHDINSLKEVVSIIIFKTLDVYYQ